MSNPATPSQKFTLYKDNTGAFSFTLLSGESPIDIVNEYLTLRVVFYARTGGIETGEFLFDYDLADLTLTNTNTVSATITKERVNQLFGKGLNFVQLVVTTATRTETLYVNQVQVFNDTNGAELSNASTLDVDGDFNVTVNVSTLTPVNTSRGIDSIADLRLTRNTTDKEYVEVLGYYEQGDGGGGQFYWDADSVKSDNGGTIIKVTEVTTGRWKRVINEIVYLAWFGAKGDGVTIDTDAINLALASGKKVYGKRNAVYLINNQLFVSENTIVDGLGCTFKRASEIKTTLTSNILSTTTTIPVADASLFKVGDKINILNGVTKDDISATKTISSISGDNLIIGTTIGVAFTSGDTVIKEFSLLTSNGKKNITVKNITFDGNKANNTATRFWIVWVNLNTIGENTRIENCHFKNSPCENMFVSGPSWVINCTYEDLGGSFVHIGNGQVGSRYYTNILNCVGTNSNVYLNSDSGHSEAIITYSQGVKHLNIINCDFRNSNQSAFLGPIAVNSDVNVTDTNLHVEGCYIEDTSEGFYMVNSSNASFSGLTIKDNIFKSCYGSYVTPAPAGFDVLDYATGKNVTKNISITGNIFEDTMLSLIGIESCIIANNEFLVKTDFSSNKNIEYHDQSMLFISGRDVLIVGNNFKSNLFVSFTEVAIKLGNFDNMTDPLNSSLAVVKDVSVLSNNIVGFGIAVRSNLSILSTPEYYYEGWVIDGNNIITNSDFSFFTAIFCYSGWKVTNNNIICTGNNGIRANGCDSADVSTWSKTIIVGNTITGNVFSSAILYGNVETANSNHVIANNVHESVITLENATGAIDNVLSQNVPI